MKIQIIKFGTPAWEESLELRKDILGQSFSREELNKEEKHIHLAVYDEDTLVATTVLTPEARGFKMQRVAVRADYQNRGIGSLLVRHSEDLTLKAGINRIYCHARDSAVDFYRKHDFKAIGEFFLEDGIPHQKLEKFLKLT